MEYFSSPSVVNMQVDGFHIPIRKGFEEVVEAVSIRCEYVRQGVFRTIVDTHRFAFNAFVSSRVDGGDEIASRAGGKELVVQEYRILGSVDFIDLERRARIELATLAWKAKVIPFYERRIILLILGAPGETRTPTPLDTGF